MLNNELYLWYMWIESDNHFIESLSDVPSLTPPTPISPFPAIEVYTERSILFVAHTSRFNYMECSLCGVCTKCNQNCNPPGLTAVYIVRGVGEGGGIRGGGQEGGRNSRGGIRGEDHQRVGGCKNVNLIRFNNHWEKNSYIVHCCKLCSFFGDFFFT